MWAIVTGASSGIGVQYAEQLAADYGYDILLVSNQETELEQVAQRIRQNCRVETQTLVLDLSAPNAAEQVFELTQSKKMDVEVLVNNAGILVFDLLNRVEPARLETLLGLHVVTLTKLCRLFGETMRQRGRGFMLNMSSMTAWTALPTIQAYNATKNYVLQFSRSFWYEMMPQGVHVLAVTPGSTNTGLLPFPEPYARLLLQLGITMQPETLVRKALRKLFRTRRKVYLPGAWNRLTVPVLKHLPDRLIMLILKKLMM